MKLSLRWAVGAVALTALISQAQTTTSTQTDVVQLDKFEVNELRSFSDQAILGKTPVSFTELTKSFITDSLASRDVPFALESTPSFYVTNSGGGAGDSRISVRGFSQRNVSILINGVPTNDIENWWLYWSNWDGLGDASSSIQLQRGLSNVTLPTPSIGGTLNIITDPAAAQRGASLKLEAGQDDFFKQTYTVNTGLLGKKFAATVSYSTKKSDGYYDGTWTEASSYYVGLAYQITPRHRVELYGISAPQRHGQNSYEQNIATYDQGYARKLGYTDAQLALFPTQGRRYNQQYNTVSSTYAGLQYYWGGLHGRQNGGSLNQTENYYRKPQANLNWYFNISDDLKLSTVVYYSGGNGGGSGTLGTVQKVTSSTTSPYPLPVDWDKTIAVNQASTTGSKGVLRNSVNTQDQYGAIAKLTYKVNSDLKLTAGVDWRTAKLDHYREIRDLLGGSYYTPTTAMWKYYYDTGKSIATTQPQLGLGDKIDYFNSNSVDWLGTFLQGQYSRGPITAFAVYGYSLVDYGYVNHFVLNSDGSERKIDVPIRDGHQLKGGIQYAFTPQVSAYANLGWVSKVPIFDASIVDDDPGRKVANPKNEKFNSYETGVRYTSKDRKLTLSAGFYYTLWRDCTAQTYVNESYKFADGTTGAATVYQRDIDTNYGGVEFEAAYKPSRLVRFDVAGSFGNWYYTKNGKTEIYQTSTDSLVSTSVSSIKGLKVGDSPQSQIAYGATFFPVKDLSINFKARWNDRYYASYDAASRSDDYAQSWRIPAFTVFDMHVNYKLPLKQSYTVEMFAHILNIANKTYVQDATDNYFYASQTANAAAHSAQRAEVFLGTPFTFNAGVKFTF